MAEVQCRPCDSSLAGVGSEQLCAHFRTKERWHTDGTMPKVPEGVFAISSYCASEGGVAIERRTKYKLNR